MVPPLELARYGRKVVRDEVLEQRRALEVAGAYVVDEAHERVELLLVEWDVDGAAYGVCCGLGVAAQQLLGLLLAHTALELGRLRAVAVAEVHQMPVADCAVAGGIVVQVRA